MNRINRITRFLCALLPSLVLLLLLPANTAKGEPEPPESYVYAVDIEFGNLAFYYDYGVWNVNTMRYEASPTSAYPAVGTVNGFPGWYGFDEQSNLVKITNSSSDDRHISFSLSYRPLLDATELSEASVNASVSGVNMRVYQEDDTELVGNIQVAANPNASVSLFIHLHGVPRLDGNTVYSSSAMQPIGMLTIRIEDWYGKSAAAQS